jgi:hypothetical protein
MSDITTENPALDWLLDRTREINEKLAEHDTERRVLEGRLHEVQGAISLLQGGRRRPGRPRGSRNADGTTTNSGTALEPGASGAEPTKMERAEAALVQEAGNG